MKKARLAMILDYPFFGNLALSIKLVKNPNIPSAAINSETLQYNPAFIESLDAKERLFIYLHEIGHIILGHSFRRKDRHIEMWNIACDYAVNLLIKDVLKQKMPDVGLYDPKYKDMPAESIYDQLMSEYQQVLQSQSNEGGNNGQDSGSSDDESDSSTSDQGGSNNEKSARRETEKETGSDESDETGGLDTGNKNSDEHGQDDQNNQGNKQDQSSQGQQEGSDQDQADKSNKQDAKTPEQKAIEQKTEQLKKMFEEAQRNGIVEDAPPEITEHSVQAKMVATQRILDKQAGTSGTPEEVRKVVKRFVNTKLNWKTLLANFLTEACQSRYNWMIPNRRYSFGDVIMPSLRAQDAINMVIAIDTSGSINKKELQVFFDEVNVLTASFEYEAIHIVSCDTKIHAPEKFLKHQPIEYEPVGGGGTHATPVWKWIKDENLNPACVLYFTDLEIFGGFWGDDPGYPVLWIGKFWEKDKKVPFGQKILLEI